jgi:hypothetical protein
VKVKTRQILTQYRVFPIVVNWELKPKIFSWG